MKQLLLPIMLGVLALCCHHKKSDSPTPAQTQPTEYAILQTIYSKGLNYVLIIDGDTMDYLPGYRSPYDGGTKSRLWTITKHTKVEYFSDGYEELIIKTYLGPHEDIIKDGDTLIYIGKPVQPKLTTIDLSSLPE